MIEFGEMLIDNFGDYGNPGMKITRLVKEGKIIRLKNGLYETEEVSSIFQPAQAIYGPSYISFGTALSYYGIVPEHAFHVTNATYRKHRDKYFKTDICSYYYTDVPSDVFNLEVDEVQMDGYTFRIATREKAVCDKLYKMPPMKDTDELAVLMFDDLRFDEEYIAELNYNTVTELSDRYGCKNVRLLSEYLGAIS